MAFHINDRGEAHACSAQQGNCPFGGLENHYSTPEQARTAFEASMAGEAFKARTEMSKSAQERLPGWSWTNELDGRWALHSEDSNLPGGDGFAVVERMDGDFFKVSVMDVMGEVQHEDSIRGLESAHELAEDLMVGLQSGQ